ncbi:MAG TPA: hypothetical protein VML55_01245 [Planctomycetaceae bacterium]|nr:hypothetical protein [Planctomycetaceae bacterium]
MRTLAALAITLVLSAPTRADALTLKDLVELFKAGLSDEVLVALIEVNNSIYSLEAETIKQLKADGLSDRVIIAVINSGRSGQPVAPVAAVEPEPAPEPAPTVVVIDHHDPAPGVVVQQVPVYVPVQVGRSAPRRAHDVTPTPASPYYTGQVQERPRKAPEPVYWGFGGKLRPDAWQPTPQPERGRDKGKDGKDDKADKPKDRGRR